MRGGGWCTCAVIALCVLPVRGRFGCVLRAAGHLGTRAVFSGYFDVKKTNKPPSEYPRPSTVLPKCRLWCFPPVPLPDELPYDGRSRTAQPRKRNVFFAITSPPGAIYGGSFGIALNSTTRRHPRLGLVSGLRGPTQIHIRGLCHWAGEPEGHLGAESPPSRRTERCANARKYDYKSSSLYWRSIALLKAGNKVTAKARAYWRGCFRARMDLPKKSSTWSPA